MSGCTVFGDCIDWKLEGKCDDSGDEVGQDDGPEIAQGVHACSEITGNCLLSELVDFVPFPEFFRDAIPSTGTCELVTSLYPCGDFSLEGQPIMNGRANLDAFGYTCGTCPDARTTTDDPAFFQGALPAVAPLISTFGCMGVNADPIDYLSFGNGFAASYNGQEGIEGIECWNGESEFPLTRPWCGFGDRWCTSICTSDADCNDGGVYKAYMEFLIGPGEAQCAGWPMALHDDPASGQSYETAHGCVWNTGDLVIPPAPVMGGMLVEHSLVCDDGVCEIDEALVDFVMTHLDEAAIGLDYQVNRDGSVALALASYAYAVHIGLQDGDVIDAVGLEGKPVSAGAVTTAIAELAAGETSFQVRRGSARVEFVIVLR
jgi:hypothetical protein